MVIAGQNIYAAGFINNGGNDIAALWKNGSITLLSDGTINSYALSMAISGNDIYIAGYQTPGNYSQAIIWKNGLASVLNDTTISAMAGSVAISGNDVYVAGFTQLRPLIPNAYDVPTYWKNGAPVSLSITCCDLAGVANSIAIWNNSVYVVGYTIDETSISSLPVIETWTTGYSFPGPGGAAGEANVIVIDSGNIFVAGQLNNSGYAKAAYWENGADSSLDDGAAAVQSIANALFIRH